MLHSNYRPLSEVRLPPWKGRQVYMHTFDLATPTVPQGFEDYAPVVDLLCWSAEAHEGFAHMTVDEKIVQAGMSQRKPKPHVDGCFVPDRGVWGHPGWLHTCNDISCGPIARMPVIVASSVPGCKVWRGTFDAEPKSDGDLSHLTLPEGALLPANVGYLLSPDCVHESIVFAEPTQRTFLRIALPVEFKF
jgi:hypothetical protein